MAKCPKWEIVYKAEWHDRATKENVYCADKEHLITSIKCQYGQKNMDKVEIISVKQVGRL